jgi:hypothetical protein
VISSSAREAVDLYRQDPPEERRLGELCLARLDIAVARLGQENLEGAADEVGEVLSVASRRRTDSVVRRLRQRTNALKRPRFQTTALAADLRERATAQRAPHRHPAAPVRPGPAPGPGGRTGVGNTRRAGPVGG